MICPECFEWCPDGFCYFCNSVIFKRTSYASHKNSGDVFFCKKTPQVCIAERHGGFIVFAKLH